MASFKENMNNFSTQAKTFWDGLTNTRKAILGGSLVLGILAIVSVVSMSRSESMEYIFVNLSPEDSAAIISYFQKSGIQDYIADNKGIKVPLEKAVEYRLKLTQEGLPSHGQVGWEKFDDTDFTRTEFERRINKMRALQGELSRTIALIDGIASARVHITTPQQKLFEKEEKKPTAAVYIKPKTGVQLSQRQIRGIVHLVSKSVEGLEQDYISIIDYDGKLLTEEKVNDPTARENKEALEYKKNIEKQMEEKIRGIVGRIVGQERVEAKVEVTVDFTKEEQTVADIDPDRVVVLSQNTTTQSTDGSGLNPTGIPGSKSNVPGDQADVQAATSSVKNNRESELLNYEVAKTTKHRVLASGSVQRISAAVIVDGKQLNHADGSIPEFVARSEDEMKKISELVKSAIGYVEGRDEVKVHNLMFQLDYVQVEALNVEKAENREYISTLAISSVVALALVLFFAFVVRPYLRWLSYDPQRKERQAIVEEFKPDLEVGSVQNVQVREDVPFEKLSVQEQVNYIAKNDPIRTTEALRMLLNPHA